MFSRMLSSIFIFDFADKGFLCFMYAAALSFLKNLLNLPDILTCNKEEGADLTSETIFSFARSTFNFGEVTML